MSRNNYSIATITITLQLSIHLISIPDSLETEPVVVSYTKTKSIS